MCSFSPFLQLCYAFFASLMLDCQSEGRLQSIRFHDWLLPSTIVSFRCGLLLFTCMRTYSLYVADFHTAKARCIAGTGKNGPPKDGDGLSASFGELRGLAVSDRTRCAYISDTTHHLIRCVTLPPPLFDAEPVTLETL